MGCTYCQSFTVMVELGGPYYIVYEWVKRWVKYQHDVDVTVSASTVQEIRKRESTPE